MSARWIPIWLFLGAGCTDGETDEPIDTNDTDETDNPLEGTEVTVFGPERGEAELDAIAAALDALSVETGIVITYSGFENFEGRITQAIATDSPPDIAMFPQPGVVAALAASGDVLPLPAEVVSEVETNTPAAWRAFGDVDGSLYGVVTKADLKSLVWYKPSAFAAAGYSVPTTWAELLTLGTTMIADGHTPWCVGIESGGATGWVFTDWVEDLVLRMHGAELYDDWVDHSIPFNDARIVASWHAVLDLWNTPGTVHAEGGTIADTSFAENGDPLANGDCLMHKQASFFPVFLPPSTPLGDGSDDAIDVFYFPPVESSNSPVLGAGIVASAFRDAPEVWEVMRYLSSPEYAEARQLAQSTAAGGGTSGFLSVAIGIEAGTFGPFEQNLMDIMAGGTTARFDASDLMPIEVGAGTFWTEGTKAVNGDVTVEEATAAIEASWP